MWGGKRFSDFELRNRPTEGTQTRMTVEQYRQMAESLPEKKSYSSMGTLMSGGGSEQYRRGLPPKGTSYGMGRSPGRAEKMGAGKAKNICRGNWSYR